MNNGRVQDDKMTKGMLVKRMSMIASYLWIQLIMFNYLTSRPNRFADLNLFNKRIQARQRILT